MSRRHRVPCGCCEGGFVCNNVVLTWFWLANRVDFMTSTSVSGSPVPLLPGDTDNELVLSGTDTHSRPWTATFTFHEDGTVTVAGSITGFSDFEGESTSLWDFGCEGLPLEIPLTFTHPFIDPFASTGDFTISFVV
jgi:hypothetical protein